MFRVYFINIVLILLCFLLNNTKRHMYPHSQGNMCRSLIHQEKSTASPVDTFLPLPVTLNIS